MPSESSVVWNQESLQILIQLMKNSPVIWNPNHKDFKNKGLKEKAYSSICNVLKKKFNKDLSKLTTGSLIKKWLCLRCYYGQLYTRECVYRKYNKPFKNIWSHYESLSFLNDNRYFKNKKTDGWTKEMEKRCIELVKPYDHLWNRKHPLYAKRVPKEDAFRKIKDSLKILFPTNNKALTLNKCILKWNSLKKHYLFLKKQKNKNRKSWVHFDSLSFIDAIDNNIQYSDDSYLTDCHINVPSSVLEETSNNVLKENYDYIIGYPLIEELKEIINDIKSCNKTTSNEEMLDNLIAKEWSENLTKISNKYDRLECEEKINCILNSFLLKDLEQMDQS